MPYDTGDTIGMKVALLRSKYATEYISMLQSFTTHLLQNNDIEFGGEIHQLAMDAFTNGFAGGLAFGTGLTLEDVENTDD